MMSCAVLEPDAPAAEVPADDIARLVHDLCQPLTTLQCRLEIAGLVGTAQAYHEAVDAGLEECGRLMDCVASLRELVVAARQASVSRPGTQRGLLST